MSKTKGHWPKGKRRNSPRGWPTLLQQFREILRDRIACREAARRIGVHESTIRHWRDERQWPSEENCASIRALIRMVRK